MNIARRQSSSTSMARFARESEAVDLHSPDFCNAFWGKDPEKGVEALLTRMRIAGRTVEELRAFWRERQARDFLSAHTFLLSTLGFHCSSPGRPSRMITPNV